MGLLDFPEDPQKQALLMMGLGLLGGAPNGRKNFGADLSHAGMLGMQTLAASRQAQAQAAAQKQAQELQGIQLAQAKQGMADEQAYRGAIGGAPNFAAPSAPNMAPTPENAAQLKAPSPYEQASKMVEYLRAKGVNEKHIKPYVDQMEKMKPKFKADQQIVKLPDGSLGLLNLGEDGSHQVVPYKPAEEVKGYDTGGQTQLVGKYGTVGQSLQNTLSPNTLFTGNVTMRGQNMTDARQRDLNAITREGQQTQILETPNGPIAVNKGTAVSRPVLDGSGKAVPGEAQMKRESGAKNVLSLLDDAEKLLPNATNSLVGAGVDIAGNAVGLPTGGAKAIAGLKSIEGALLAQMPRMEGPQSNYDVQMYKQAAGMLGDPTKPTGLKMEAIKAIRTIQQRYAGNGGFRVIGRE